VSRSENPGELHRRPLVSGKSMQRKPKGHQVGVGRPRYFYNFHGKVGEGKWGGKEDVESPFSRGKKKKITETAHKTKGVLEGGAEALG